jgi:hypothetical protein
MLTKFIVLTGQQMAKELLQEEKIDKLKYGEIDFIRMS